MGSSVAVSEAATAVGVEVVPVGGESPPTRVGAASGVAAGEAPCEPALVWDICGGAARQVVELGRRPPPCVRREE